LYSADHHIFTYPQPTKELREGTNLGRFKVSAVIVSDAVSFVSAAKESMEAVLFSKVRRLAIHVVSWSDMGFNQKKIPNQLSAQEISDGLLDFGKGTTA